MAIKICEKCGNKFPAIAKIDGKKRNLKGRKYCFECSPFGLHNTKNLDEKSQRYNKATECRTCKRPISYDNNRKKCHYCAIKRRTKSVTTKLYTLTGFSCWYCHYDKGQQATPVLEFHHIDRKTKNFSLNCREIISNSWEKVLNEAKKCVMLCCRCHREVEYQLISTNDIEKIYKKKWKEIEERKDINHLLYPSQKKPCIPTESHVS